MIRVLAGALMITGLAFASGGEGGEGNIMLWKTVNTLILVAGLYFIYQKWISPALEKRRQNVAELVNEAKSLKEESEKNLREAERKLEEAKMKFQETLKIARETAENERQQAIKEAEEMANRIKKQAEETIDVEIKKAQNELRKYAVHKAIEISEKLVKESVNPDIEREMIKKTLKSLS
ncbi:MAG: ATP synthase F0 subunit B [Persephonella sp.]|nr:MAG: ATP synthase F0 subunit B [Persephonella sp.]